MAVRRWSGGSILVGSTNVQLVEIVLHASGHTFGLLGDEYTAQPPPWVNTVEPAEANAPFESINEEQLVLRFYNWGRTL